nr:uncharacterized protein LOC123278022 [Equus asinus]
MSPSILNTGSVTDSEETGHEAVKKIRRRSVSLFNKWRAELPLDLYKLPRSGDDLPRLTFFLLSVLTVRSDRDQRQQGWREEREGSQRGKLCSLRWTQSPLQGERRPGSTRRGPRAAAPPCGGAFQGCLPHTQATGRPLSTPRTHATLSFISWKDMLRFNQTRL